MTANYDNIVIHFPSNNFDARAAAITMIVLHYTDMADTAQALTRLCDPQAKVSAHYLIDEAGRVYSLVDEENRAWHAGLSYWRGSRDINSRSVGIELANLGHSNGYVGFPEIQLMELRRLLERLVGLYQIPLENIVGHSDIAPARKKDPGEKFPWKRFASWGLGIWPEPGKNGDMNDEEFHQALKDYGYDPDVERSLLTEAFSRHFGEGEVSAEPTPFLKRQAQGLLEKITPARCKNV